MRSVWFHYINKLKKKNKMTVSPSRKKQLVKIRTSTIYIKEVWTLIYESVIYVCFLTNVFWRYRMVLCMYAYFVPCAYSARKSQKTASILDGNLKTAVDSGKLKVWNAMKHFVYSSDRGLWPSRTANAFNHWTICPEKAWLLSENLVYFCSFYLTFFSNLETGLHRILWSFSV